MRNLFLTSVILLLVQGPARAQENSFQVLAYHDVRDRVTDDFDADQYAISTANLIDHFTWLRINGFTVVSAEEILSAGHGGNPLPERAVLLTFDDGFASVATHVLPLLELFDYPAVISIVTDWIESDPEVSQGGRTLTRDDFLSWAEIGELARHDLIEIASHSHRMHKGIVGNPQGNEQRAAVTLAYAEGHYETPEAYTRRVADDLESSVERIEAATGQRPRIMTWPFGAFNASTLEAARDLGMEMTLTLTDGINRANDVSIVARHLIQANPGVAELGWSLLHPLQVPIVRAAQVDLDYVYDPDPARQEENLGHLLDRIQALEITHVFLQAFADPDADGGAQALYFPNSYLPMRSDLFNRAAWQLKTRSNVLVYAWMPILSFEGESIDPVWRVSQEIDGEVSLDEQSEPRLSPYAPEAREIINGIYKDLARHAAFDGILFHDDGRFNEFEDASLFATRFYRQRFGENFSLAALSNDPELAAAWSRFRSDAIIELSAELADTVRIYRPEIRTARNLFATALLEPDPERRLAQNFERFLDAYDFVALMAMPRFESYPDHREFYESLARQVTATEDHRTRTIFELQTVDWPAGTPIDSREIRDTMRDLQSLGIRNLAYYPEDFVQDHPDLEALRQGMSIAVFPRGNAR